MITDVPGSNKAELVPSRTFGMLQWLALALGRRMGASFAQGLPLGIAHVSQSAATSLNATIRDDHPHRHRRERDGKYDDRDQDVSASQFAAFSFPRIRCGNAGLARSSI